MPPFPFKRLLPLLLPLLALPACGVVFTSAESGTEMFKSIDLRGDFIANTEIVVTLEVASSYPVPVRIACYYDAAQLGDDQERIVFQERATLIGERVLEPLPDGVPDENADLRTLSFGFSVAQRGDYEIACITPAAPENGILDDFTIKAASDVSADQPWP